MRLVFAVLMLTATPAFAKAPVTVTKLFSGSSTASGQPIILPQRDVHVVVSKFVIQPGATLPVHQHPAQRYAYVMSGEVRVTLSETGQTFDYKAGDFIVEVRDQWHYGTAIGTEPTVLLVIDQVSSGESNTVVKPGQ